MLGDERSLVIPGADDRRPRPRGVVKDMVGALVKAIIFGIGVELGRDIYGKMKGGGAAAKAPEPPPDEVAVDEAPQDEPPTDGSPS